MTEPRELTQVDATALIWRDIIWILRHFQVKDKDLTAPPGAPVEGDRYIIAAGATGAWATHDNQLVEWHAMTGATAAWHYVKPFEGFETWVEDENVNYRWDGSAWDKLPGTSPSSTGVQYYEKHTVTAGEAASGVIDLTGGNTYTTGNNSLQVFLNGQLQTITDDYAETDSNTVTFVGSRLSENDVIVFRWYK